jgi:hypothetical protein
VPAIATWPKSIPSKVRLGPELLHLPPPNIQAPSIWKHHGRHPARRRPYILPRCIFLLDPSIHFSSA